jgi:competence ComEA-like helix-hairpin-helix protein
MTPEHEIDLNAASAEELTQLPGIAKDLAHRIVSYRKRHAGFSSWEDLQNVHGFPLSRLDEIKSRAILGTRPSVEVAPCPKSPHSRS